MSYDNYFSSNWLLGGMPMIRLSDVASFRLQAISFFILLIVLSSLVIWAVWNWLRRDLAFLPKLSFRGAAGMTLLWGVMFVIVLTMISGARELMTPGAWTPNGSTYVLAEEKSEEDAASIAIGREEEIKLWAAVLKYYQGTHGGSPPETRLGLATAARDIGMNDLADSLENDYWYDPSPEKSSPIRLRQIGPTGATMWGVSADGVILKLDDEPTNKEASAEKPPKTDSDDS